MKCAIFALLFLGMIAPAEAQNPCNQFTRFNHAGPTGPIEVAKGDPAKRIYFCGFLLAQKGNTLDFHLLIGQGTNCSENPQQLVYLQLPNDVQLSNRIEHVGPSGDYGYSMCLQTTGTGLLGGVLYWAQY
jgi:hypothetical protein